MCEIELTFKTSIADLNIRLEKTGETRTNCLDINNQLGEFHDGIYLLKSYSPAVSPLKFILSALFRKGVLKIQTVQYLEALSEAETEGEIQEVGDRKMFLVV